MGACSSRPAVNEGSEAVVKGPSLAQSGEGVSREGGPAKTHNGLAGSAGQHVTTVSARGEDMSSKTAAVVELAEQQQQDSGNMIPSANLFAEDSPRGAAAAHEVHVCTLGEPEPMPGQGQGHTGAGTAGAGVSSVFSAVSMESQNNSCTELGVHACMPPSSHLPLSASLPLSQVSHNPMISCCGSGMSGGEIMFDCTALENGGRGLAHDVAKFGAPRAPNEEARARTIEVLRHMGVDSCAELDLLLGIISNVWNAPVSSVTLLDSEHVWMCNANGTQGGHKPWAVAMCPWTLLTPHPEALAVNDLALDARFHGNVHHQSGTRSYLTAPLVASNGHRLGAICFVDEKPRQFTASDCRLMSNFAELAVRELERHVRLADRLKQAEEADLATVYGMRVRDVDEVADTCVMLVDTRVEGWRLVYTSRTWREWTGVEREDCLGRTLLELLQHVHGDPEEGVVWQGLVRNARQCKPFVTPKVRVRDSIGKKGSGSGAPPLHHAFYLSFKAAAVDPLDADTVPVGVPAWVPMSTAPEVSHLYFARLYTVPNPPPPSRVNTGANVTGVTTPTMGYGGQQAFSKTVAVLGCVGNKLEQMSPALAAMQLFRGLKPSHVLGQGAFGTVWFATWHGSPVALKVVDADVHSEAERDQVLAEQTIGANLAHINVVRTLAHTSSLLDSVALRNSNGNHASADYYLKSGASCTSASWGYAGGHTKELCLVPCLGGLSNVPEQLTSDTGGMGNTLEQNLLSSGAHTAVEQAQPNSKQMSTPRWPAPHSAMTLSTSRAVVATLHSDDDPLHGRNTSAAHLVPEGGAAPAAAYDTAAAQQGGQEDITPPKELARSSTWAHSLGEGPVLGEGTQALCDLPLVSTEVESAGLGMSAITSIATTTPAGTTSHVPTYTVANWHAVGGLCTTNSAAKDGPNGWELQLLPDKPPSTPSGSNNSGAPAATVTPTPFSFETSTSSDPDKQLVSGPPLRRYSSYGLGDSSRWQRSSSLLQRTDANSFPYSLRQWVLLEFCDQGTLSNAIDRGVFRMMTHPNAPPHLAKLAATALDIAQGLTYLHSKGVIHGDLTAVNVLLQSATTQDLLPGDPRGFLAKLSDFGMSRKLHEAQESVVVGSYGCMTHMSPEVLVHRQLGYKADMYSLGVIMWQMMTGSRPWAGLSHLQVTIAVGHEHRQLQWPDWPPGSCGAQLVELGQRCCAADPDVRPSAESMVRQLKGLCQSLLAH